MISNVILCRGFALCTGYLAPNEILINKNKAATEVNQAVYTVAGNAVASSDDKPDVVLSSDCLADVSDFTGNEITYKAGLDGLAWVAINPIPETKKYQTQLVQAGNSVEVVADGAECAVICLVGNTNVSGKTIPTLNYARILPTKTVMVKALQNSVALVIKAV